jgi:hypothetical protein
VEENNHELLYRPIQHFHVRNEKKYIKPVGKDILWVIFEPRISYV